MNQTSPKTSKTTNDETPPAPNQPYPFQSEIEDLEKTLAAIHAGEDTAKPPHGAESRTAAAGRARRRGTVYGIRWEEDPGAIPGEPESTATIMFPADDADAEALEAEAAVDVIRAKLAWCRQQILALRNQLKGIEEHSEDAKAIKAGVLEAMKELLPMAKRNAKRGSPALLRLITRAVKTKL